MSRQDCTFQLIKMGFVAGNLLVFIVTLIVMGLAILFLTKFEPLKQLNIEIPNTMLILAVLLSVLVAMITFFGWYGAYKESSGLLYLYGSIVGILFLFEIGIAASLGTYLGSDFQVKLKKGVIKTLEFMKSLGGDSKLEEDQKTKLNAWHDAEDGFKCCAIEDPAVDYPEEWKQTSKQEVHKQCCKDDKGPGGKCFPRKDLVHPPCAKVIIDFINKHQQAILAATIVTILLELVAITASCGVGKVVWAKPKTADYDDYGEYDD